jgi:beta-galactosidase GanA
MSKIVEVTSTRSTLRTRRINRDLLALKKDIAFLQLLSFPSKYMCAPQVLSRFKNCFAVGFITQITAFFGNPHLRGRAKILCGERYVY